MNTNALSKERLAEALDNIGYMSLLNYTDTIKAALELAQQQGWQDIVTDLKQKVVDAYETESYEGNCYEAGFNSGMDYAVKMLEELLPQPPLTNKEE